MTKQERAKQRQENYEKYEKKFKNEIDCIVKNTTIYNDVQVNRLLKNLPLKRKSGKINKIKCEIRYYKNNISDFILLHSPNERLTILNFASYRNPGGGYLRGSNAQEEDICSCSLLYNILIRFSDVYKSRPFEGGLYGCDSIYIPNLPFIHENEIYDNVDVLSISAPNCRVNIDNKKQYIKILEDRIEAIFIISLLHGTRNLILGAFGCGVFGNDPEIVAKIFRKNIKRYGNYFKSIGFVIPDDKTFDIFREIIEKGRKEK